MNDVRHTPYNFHVYSEDDKDLMFFLNERLYWVTFINDINIYKSAMTHSSLQKVNNVSNERLEFLGDSVYGMIITEHIYSKYTTADEGALTKLRTKYVNGHTLAMLTQKLGMSKLLAVSKRINNYNKRMLEDAFEAFIGAMFIDQGIECCKRFVLNAINIIDDLGDLTIDTNYKDILLKHVQSNHIGELQYITVDTIGPPHQRLYRMQVEINNKVYGIGCASSKKEAEQHASRETLAILGNKTNTNIC